METTFDRSYADGVLPEKLENYMKELESDIKISEINIHDKTLLKPSIAAKWARFLYEEERYKKKMSESIDLLKSQIAEKIYEKKKTAIVNQTINDAMVKIEVEKVLKKTTQYQKIKEELENQEDVIRLINDARQIISQFGFDLKNSIDVLKLENI